MKKYILPILLLFFSNLLSNSISKSKNEIHLWTVLEKKITIDYANDFSSQKVEKFISYFAPNRKINLYQYGKDVTGKNNNGNTINSLIYDYFFAGHFQGAPQPNIKCRNSNSSARVPLICQQGPTF